MVEQNLRRARGTARIEFDGRSFVLPAADPYDVDTLLDHSRYLAGRYGQARIFVGGKTWQVELDRVDANPRCQKCDRREAIRFRSRDSHLCQSCSTEEMLADRVIKTAA